MRGVVKNLVRLYAALHRTEFQYPVYSEENLAHARIKDLMWLLYKMELKHPMEQGERGKGLEAYFDAQDLHFSLPDGFSRESSVVLTAGGDLLASRDAKPDTVKGLWDEAKDFFFDADLCCANLETPVVPSRPASFLPEHMSRNFALNNTPAMFDVFHQGGRGVTVFSTANNHSLDMGEDGLRETLAFLDQKGCTHVGTSASERERDDVPVVEKNGVRIAFLSYTYSLNGKKVPQGKDYLVNYMRLNLPGADLSLIERHVRFARLDKKADLVVACLHWSFEFESYPFQSLIETGHRIMDLGVDVILGNHAHGIQPLEKYVHADPLTGQSKVGLIVYALGDLVACTEKHVDSTPNSSLNNLIRLEIAKGTLAGVPSTHLSGLTIRPMLFHTRYEMGSCTDYRLLDLKKLLDELDAGVDRWNLDATGIAEVRRLGRLARKILPWDITG